MSVSTVMIIRAMVALRVNELGGAEAGDEGLGGMIVTN